MPERYDGENTLVVAMASIPPSPFRACDNFALLAEGQGLLENAAGKICTGAEDYQTSQTLLGREFCLRRLDDRAKVRRTPAPVLLARIL
jgi:hypothetical protein